jgi:hypothetical protein
LVAAQLVCGAPWAAFELCVRNADKGKISQGALEARISVFQERGLNVFLTNATTFPEKSRLFPGCKFAVGYDTAVRILDQKYYSNSAEQMVKELSLLQSNECSFAVAGRQDTEGQYKTIHDMHLTSSLQDQCLFQGIPEDVFREDVSSTELRQKHTHV